jgi:hypothetical protein
LTVVCVKSAQMGSIAALRDSLLRLADVKLATFVLKEVLLQGEHLLYLHNNSIARRLNIVLWVLHSLLYVLLDSIKI